MKDTLNASLLLFEKKTPFVVVTLTSIHGEAPSDLGNKMLVTENGLHHGTIGGGKVEARAIVYSQERLKKKNPVKTYTETWNLQKDIGMTCGGEVSFLFEVVHPRSWQIALFGAGHVAQALTRTLSTLDCEVTCTDPRSEWIERLETHPNLTCTVHATPAETVAGLSPDTFILCMTQGHAHDVPILEAAFKMPYTFPYVGAIGSAQKGMRIKGDLKNLGVSLEKIETLHCPIGLPIGSSDPGEIAISVAAQLLQVRDALQK